MFNRNKISQEKIHEIFDRKLSTLDKEISYVLEEWENETDFDKKMRKYNYLAGLEYARMVLSHAMQDVDDYIRYR